MKKTVLTLINAIAFLAITANLAQLAGQTFFTTGSMKHARASHQATLLSDGRVLVSGGQNAAATAIAQAEIYNPTTGNWRVTGSNVNARYDHAATLLMDGRVLVVGGVSSNVCTSNVTAETYSTSTGKWSLTGNLPSPVGTGMVAVRLLNGNVLVAGGGNRCGAVYKTAALFDPSTNTWSATGSMSIDRQFASAVLLSDGSGRVLVAGGVTDSPFPAVASAEIFDPSTGTWSPAGSMVTPRDASCNGFMQSYLAALTGGTVLAAGALSGSSCFSAQAAVSAAETFSSSGLSWASTGAMSVPRSSSTLTTLNTAFNDGMVLAAGGSNSASSLSSAELFNPSTGIWSATASMPAPREGHTATLLLNGQVLIAGGAVGSPGTLTATAVLYIE